MFLKGLLFMTTAISMSADLSASTNIETAMKKPLIVGASVSADWLTPSPGKQLALRYTTADHVKVIARRGTKSQDTVATLKESDFKERTSVIAIDAFFWDSTLKSPEKSISNMKTLVERTEKMGIPLVLGEIPYLLPQYQPSAQALNKEMRAQCKKARNCYVLPFDNMVKDMLLNGYVEIDKIQYTVDKLLPDGLHISEVASKYIANRIFDLLAAR